MSPEHQQQLISLARQSRLLLTEASRSEQGDLAALVNGKAADTINALLGRQLRRNDGIYFSGPEWAGRLRAALPHGPHNRYIDPSCGVGDLLMEIGRNLPLEVDLAATIADWSQRFRGMDLYAPLAHVAWSRLQALAIRRHGIDHVDPACLPTDAKNFDAVDALSTSWKLRAGDCVLMNPPFHSVPSPAWSACFGGRVTAAALFVERVITEAPTGTVIAALLPEVVRSGTRFAKLRQLIRERCRVHEFTPQGRFSNEADIDVAILSLTVGRQELELPPSSEPQGRVLGDLADVRVGTVVPHRATRGRIRRPYLDVDGAPPKAEAKVVAKERYHGKAFMPPFVVVRRTSSPSDRERARATLIRGGQPVLVENHLLVVLPKRRSLETCREIMSIFGNIRTTEWLNSMLRCRHLTVRVMMQLPLWEK